MSIRTHWIWEPEDVNNSPSMKAGVSFEEEERIRTEGIQLVMKVGKALKLPQNTTLATASVFFHRFYMFHTFFDHPPHMIALACLFLAGKVEETPKRCRDVISTAIELFPAQMVAAGTRINAQDQLMTWERLLLQTLRFDLHIVHPYQFFVEYTKGFNYGKDYLNRVVQNAWNLANEQLGTTLCLLWEPEVIAIAMLYLAFKIVKVEGSTPTPDEDPNEKQWWNLYVSNLTVETIEEIGHKLADYWERETC